MKRNQQGLTLIELMIALVLGLLLSLAAMQLLLTNQRNFTLQNAVTSINEDGQLVLRYIASDIRNAGRGNVIEGFVDPVVLTMTAEDPEGDVIRFESTDGGVGGNDTLVVRYLGLNACQGADLTSGGAKPEGEIVVNRYYVDDGSLWCSSLRQVGLSGNNFEFLTPSAVELISGVESFQVLYGVDGDVNSQVGATRFVTAGSLTAADKVVAIRVGVMLRSDDMRLPVPADPQTFSVLDQSLITPSDRSLRRVFTTTAHVRNIYWEGI